MNDTGGGNLLRLQQGGSDKFVVNGAGALITGSIGAAGVAAGSLSNAVIASSLAVNSVHDGAIISMSASKLTGALPAINGSALTGITGDDLGDHTATAALNMNGNSIVNASSGAFAASLTVAGRPVFPESGVTVVDGDTIASDRASVRLVGSGGAVTLNGAAPVAPGISGQVMVMVGGSATNTVTVPSGGDLLLSGQVPFRLGLEDVLVIGYYGGRWVELQRSDN